MDIHESTLKEMTAATNKRPRPRLQSWQFGLAMLFVLVTMSSVLAFGGRHYWPRIRHAFLTLIERPFEQQPPPFSVDPCPGCGMG